MLEQEAAVQNGVEHPVSGAEQDGYELAHQVARGGNGAQASASGRSATSGHPAEAEGEVLLELHNVHKSFGSKRILQVSPSSHIDCGEFVWLGHLTQQAYMRRHTSAMAKALALSSAHCMA